VTINELFSRAISELSDYAGRFDRGGHGAGRRILAFHSGTKGNTVYFMSIEKAKFRRPVVPGTNSVLR